jgi:DivIVA domain-containing protein
MILPADINRKQFGSTRLKEGYDQNEVDEFLDRVEEDYASVIAERDRLLREVALLRRKLDQMTHKASEADTQVMPATPVGSAEKILVAAQRTAEQVEQEANAEAGQIRAAARAEADNIRTTARSEATELRDNAEAERQRILNQLKTEQTQLEENIEILKSKRAGYKSWLRAALARIEEEEATGA